MKLAAEIVSKVLVEIASHVRPGVNTFTLDCVAESAINKLGAYSYNKNYWPSWSRFAWPTVSCISVNNIVAHGLPSETTVLQEGDLVNIDIGIIDKNGDCGDAALTVGVGNLSEEDEQLLYYAKKVTYAGIQKLIDGVTNHEVAQAMENKAAERNFVINAQMCGHRIGKKMHEEPLIYHITNPFYHGDQYEQYSKFMRNTFHEGEVVCLEPCVTFKDKWGVIDPQTGWTVQTRDHRKSAMFEHMIQIGKDGFEVLTTHFAPDVII